MNDEAVKARIRLELEEGDDGEWTATAEIGELRGIAPGPTPLAALMRLAGCILEELAVVQPRVSG